MYLEIITFQFKCNLNSTINDCNSYNTWIWNVDHRLRYKIFSMLYIWKNSKSYNQNYSRYTQKSISFRSQCWNNFFFSLLFMKWKKFKYYIRLRNIVIESITTYNNTLLVCFQRRQRVGFEKELYFMVKQDFLSSTY